MREVGGHFSTFMSVLAGFLFVVIDEGDAGRTEPSMMWTVFCGFQAFL